MEYLEDDILRILNNKIEYKEYEVLYPNNDSNIILAFSIVEEELLIDQKLEIILTEDNANDQINEIVNEYIFDNSTIENLEKHKEQYLNVVKNITNKYQIAKLNNNKQSNLN